MFHPSPILYLGLPSAPANFSLCPRLICLAHAFSLEVCSSSPGISDDISAQLQRRGQRVWRTVCLVDSSVRHLWTLEMGGSQKYVVAAIGNSNRERERESESKPYICHGHFADNSSTPTPLP